MPFYKRRNYYNYYQPWRRHWHRRRRTRKTFFRRRRKTRVRRKRFYKRRLKKLKKLKIVEYQPEKIRKCRIKGYIELFECGFGRLSQNWALYKESDVPEHEPGGGGWSIQQLTLGNLYVQHQYGMNIWTVTNRGLNLCRFLGVNLTLFRQPNTDYIFHYNLQDPNIVNKWTYPSYHPYRLLEYHQKIIVPSMQTAPLKRKLYKKKFIRPPKKMKNEWYFQEHIKDYPLLTFYATAVDLQSLFISPKAENNNISIPVLNTSLFQRPNFASPPKTTGYSPNGTNYLYGLLNAPEPYTETPLKNFVFLGDTVNNTPGNSLETGKTANNWGNPFFYEYFTMYAPTTQQNIKVTDTQIDTKKITKTDLKVQPYYEIARYNPNKDNGDGNEAYFIRNFTDDQKNWEPPKDEDLILRGKPLWLMLWGIESYINKTKKFNLLDKNGILVIRTRFFSGVNYPAYVVLNESFVNGQGPYFQDRNEINLFNNTHWYPRWKFQKETVENILSTGPGVYKTNRGTSVQAHMRYNFLFKWGGNPSKMETIADPNTQPEGPDPHKINFTNEIISPHEPIGNYIYPWDVRRDLLTKTATERITKIKTPEQFMFTDGTTSSTDPPLQKTTSQTPKTQEEEEQTLLQHLLLIQQHNEQLQQRFRQLTTILEEQ